MVNALPLVLDFALAGREGAFTGLYHLASQTAAFIGPTFSGRVSELMGDDYRLVCVHAAVSLLVALAFMSGVRAAPRPERLSSETSA